MASDGCGHDDDGCFARAIAAATDEQVPERFPWHEGDVIAEIARRHGVGVESHEGQVQFGGESAEAYFATQEASHPASVSSRAVPERAGTYDEVRRRGIAVLLAGNEDPGAFRVTSEYRILELRVAEVGRGIGGHPGQPGRD